MDRVFVVLHRDLGKLLGGRAILAHVLNPSLAKDRRHQPAAQDAFNTFAAATGATTQQPHLAHLLDADRHGHVVHARGDTDVSLTNRR